MNIALDFLKHCCKLIICGIYPMLDLYGYFVFCGIFCFEGSLVNTAGATIFFAIYCFITMIKIVLYLELFILKGQTTAEFFPQIDESNDARPLDNINPFVAEQLMNKTSAFTHLCKHCKTYKPPRTHHCSVLNRCYLKYDHYNYIFDSAIGFHNYKTYYQLLVVSMVASLFFIIVIALEVAIPPNPARVTTVNYIVSIALFFISACYNGQQLLLHTRLICNNETSVEHSAINAYQRGDRSWAHTFQEGPICSDSPLTDRHKLNPYYLGCRNNWREVFGPSPIGWFTTTFTSLGSGAAFKTNDAQGNEDIIYDIL
ncbi:palmitoyltransferase ZDHHC2/15/20 [Pancytospora philotis]|nr:palmitoyltransferase ZDHHC2/15/20 [Pancytospora philotis]